MTRSLWLRVYDMQLFALFRLGFPQAPELPSLNLAAYRNSQAHSTKGTLPPFRAVTSCRFMVSGSISLPSPGFFSSFPHGTCPLSVANSYLALDRGRPGFRQDFSCPAVLRYCTGKITVFRIRGFHPLCQAFPNLSTIHLFYHLLYVSPCSPTTPVNRVWALPISLATTFGISFDVFSLSYLDGSVHSVSLYLSILFKSVMIESLLPGYPIRLSPDHRICAPPRSFSQLITAFFAGWLQDIHHKPILRLTILCSLLKTIVYSTIVKNVSFHLIFLLSG